MRHGTTNEGGATGGGVAFKLVGKKETVLHSFCSENNCKDGTYLTSGLIMDAAGNLYGTAAYGGDVNCDYPSGCGVVFQLTGKKETVLHSFKDSPDGANPVAALFMDAGGNLYGTTDDGGKGSNGGTVFKIGQHGKERLLHTFRGAHDGSAPDVAVEFSMRKAISTAPRCSTVSAVAAPCSRSPPTARRRSCTTSALATARTARTPAT